MTVVGVRVRVRVLVLVLVLVRVMSPASSPPSLETIASSRLSAPVEFSIMATAAPLSPVFVSIWSPVPLVVGGRIGIGIVESAATTPAPSTSATPSATSVLPFRAMCVPLVSDTPVKTRVRWPYTPPSLRLPLIPWLFIRVPSESDIHDTIL